MIINADCIHAMKDMPDNSVDSIVTDPPYGLVSIVKRFGGKKSKNTPGMETKEGGVWARKAKGFMGKAWDGSGIEYSVEMWTEALRVLKPGGHLLSFGGSRTYHRMAVAIEDAGFEIRDQIMWVYGSGFPKSLNIGKAVDKLQGNERSVVGMTRASIQGKPFEESYPEDTKHINVTKGTSPWEGWGTALKPAHEPIVVARKPLSEKTVVENVLRWGTGGINIDGSRVATDPSVDDMLRTVERGKRETETWERGSGFKNEANSLTGVPSNGRFPANFIHDGSDEVLSLFPNSSSIERRTSIKAENGKGGTNILGNFGSNPVSTPSYPDDNNRSTARFFYCAKASKRERNEGNNHPTVKPIALMQYLVKLVTPPQGIVLDPFMGSGTTGIACKRGGFEFIGIEMDEEYYKIAEARIHSYE